MGLFRPKEIDVAEWVATKRSSLQDKIKESKEKVEEIVQPEQQKKELER